MLIIIDISSHELLSNVQVQFDAFEKQTDQTNENTIWKLFKVLQCPDVFILCFVNESNSIIATNSPRKWSTNKSSFNKHNILCWQKLKQKIPHHFEFRCIKTMYAFIDDNTMYMNNRPLKRLCPLSSVVHFRLSCFSFILAFLITFTLFFVHHCWVLWFIHHFLHTQFKVFHCKNNT